MKEEEAIAIAKDYVQREELTLGKILGARFFSKQSQLDAGLTAPAEGRWLVSFEYNGPPIEKNPNEVICPEPGGPTAITVGDESREANIVMEL